MSDFSVLLGRLRTNLLMKGVRFKRFNSTSAGAAAGTTIISTTLSELDDYWNGCTCVKIDTTQEALEQRKVVDFTASSDTLDFTGNPWDVQIASGVTFELYEPGTWRGDELKRFLLEAADLFCRTASRDILENFVVRETKTASLGVVDTPSKVLRYEDPRVSINGQKVDVLPASKYAYLDEGAFIDTVNGKYIGYFAGRSGSSQDVSQFLFTPKHNKDCEFTFIPVPEFDINNAWKVPEEAWTPIVHGAAQLSLQANGMVELGQGWEREMLKFLPGQRLDG